MNKSKPTIRDIAEHAGVSIGTVSRVINGAPNISPKNLHSVQTAISELEYKKAGSSSRSLVTRNLHAGGRTGNIGMVFANTGEAWSNHPLLAAYTVGVEQACQQEGVHALIEFCSDDKTLPRCAAERKIDGLLIKSTQGAPAFVQQLPADFPVILIGTNDPALNLPQIAPDSIGSGWFVTEYLWNRGHRRIAFLCTSSLHPQFMARQQGYEGFLKQRRCFNPSLLIARQPEGEGGPRPPEQTPPDVGAEVDRLFSLPPDQRPTAIITANDWMAYGLYTALGERGLRIPDDVSVVGFDNTELLWTLMTPALTSFDVGFAAQSKAAAFDLLRMIETPSYRPDNSVRLVRGTIVERSSVCTRSL